MSRGFTSKQNRTLENSKALTNDREKKNFEWSQQKKFQVQNAATTLRLIISLLFALNDNVSWPSNSSLAPDISSKFPEIKKICQTDYFWIVFQHTSGCLSWMLLNVKWVNIIHALFEPQMQIWLQKLGIFIHVLLRHVCGISQWENHFRMNKMTKTQVLLH